MEQTSEPLTQPAVAQTETLSREEKIRRYLETPVPDGKTLICRFNRRGCCVFSAEQCKYAHGVADFQFKKLDIKDFEKDKPKPDKAEGNGSGAKSKPKKKKEEKLEEDGEPEEGGEAGEGNQDRYAEKKSGVQPPLGLELSYQGLYDYQAILKERGELETEYSLNDINNSSVIRNLLRFAYARDIQQNFVDFLFKEYNTRVLRKELVEKFFLNANWLVHWKYLLVKGFAYEVKSYIVRQPVGKDFDNYMEDCVIKVIKEKGLLDQIPISPSIITKLYYQLLGPLDPYMPTHQVYLRYRDFETFDDYLDTLQNSEGFRKKLVEACGKTIEELGDIPIFDHSNNEMKELMTQMKQILSSMLEKSHIGFIMYTRFEERVMKECDQRLQQFKTNLPQIKKLMVKIALEANALIVNLNDSVYLFSIEKFKKVNVGEIKGKYYEKLYSGCPLSPSDHIALHQLPNLREENFDATVSNKKTDEFLQEELDIRKLVLVDNEESLKEAIEHLSGVDAIGVDLEGSLRKNGNLELVQCASRSKIFIFDVYNVKKMAKENEKYVGLYREMALFLKKITEDPKICKIFHDGRKDSLALHIFLDACPSNVFDLSAVFMLTEHLEAYKGQKNNNKPAGGDIEEEKKTSDKKKETKKNGIVLEGIWTPVEGVNLPGLNEVLEKYQASHGINKLKYIMKSRFESLPLEYFLKRPIDREYLIYSARDVEDLIEVKEKMEKKLKELLIFFVGNIEEERVDLLCKKVSKTYALHGCENREQN